MPLGNRDKSDLTVFRNIRQSLALADLLFQRQYAGRGNGQFVEPDIEELFGQGKIRAETGDEARSDTRLTGDGECDTGGDDHRKHAGGFVAEGGE